MSSDFPAIPTKESLLKLARWEMPFGRYQGWLLADLPENYLLWFSQTGFPAGELGLLMALLLEMRREGLEGLLIPLKPKGHIRPQLKEPVKK